MSDWEVVFPYLILRAISPLLSTTLLRFIFFRLVCSTRQHFQERVVGIGFQPGLDVAKVSTCQIIDYADELELISNKLGKGDDWR